ncbi:MAG: hypothetical protein AAGK97_18560, partial [Bacteroidota bacterium]
GRNFFLIGYRIFVKYYTKEGKRLRGLYIIKSETNKCSMQFFGNLFTHYNYTTTDIQITNDPSSKTIASQHSDFKLELALGEEEVELPKGSPFNDWKEARRYAGPLPFTFTWETEKKEMLIIQGLRSNWKPKPFRVIQFHSAFIDHFNFKEARLANAFLVEQIPYTWKKAIREQW